LRKENQPAGTGGPAHGPYLRSYPCFSHPLPICLPTLACATRF
jgi:hypothetical protein